MGFFSSPVNSPAASTSTRTWKCPNTASSSSGTDVNTSPSNNPTSNTAGASSITYSHIDEHTSTRISPEIQIASLDVTLAQLQLSMLQHKEEIARLQKDYEAAMAKRESLLNQKAARQQKAGVAEVPSMPVLMEPAKGAHAARSGLRMASTSNNPTPLPKKENTKLLRKGDAEAKDTDVEGEATVAEEVQNRRKRLKRLIRDLS